MPNECAPLMWQEASDVWVGGRGLGLIGGIVGLIASAFVLLVGVLGRAVPSENSGLLVVSGVLGLAVSVIALVGATRAQVNPCSLPS